MSPHGVEDPVEMMAMMRTMAEAGYRDLSPSANAVRLAVARRLSRHGVDGKLFDLLWEYARACDDRGSPERLFAYWLESPGRTLDKLKEMRTHNIWIGKRMDDRDKAKPPQEIQATIIDLASRKRI